MKILALEKQQQGVSTKDFEPYLQDEARAVWDMVQSGILREIHFRDDRSQAVVILEADDTRQAEEALARLPLVREGLIEFEVIGLRPYPGFGRLFK